MGGVIGGYILVWAWRLALAIYEAAARSRSHQSNAAIMAQPLLQRRGHVAWDIVLLFLALVAVAALVFLIINLVMFINVMVGAALSPR
jgi:hypothetical protein